MARIDEEQAGRHFDRLADLAATLEQPSTVEAAMQLVETAAITPLNAEAIQYYVSEGSPVANLSDTIRRSGANALAAGQLALRLGRPGDGELGAQRRIFQDLAISLAPSLDAVSAPGLARRLITTLAHRLGVGREFLKQAERDPVSAWMAGRDLLEAAAVAEFLADLVDNPVEP